MCLIKANINMLILHMALEGSRVSSRIYSVLEPLADER